MKLIAFILLTLSFSAFAQAEKPLTRAEVENLINQKMGSSWYEKIHLKGYAQFRYNRLLETNKDLKCSACDKSMGEDQGFFMRRARLVFYGELSERIYFYVQPDYATDAAGSQNYLQIRDAYFDYALTADKDLRVRLGISKVPFGFENLQSSSNRGPMDRADGLNTGAPNERDTGVFFYYTPSHIRSRLKALTKNNLKGTGDYGMLSMGVYNGQTVNKSEKNNDLHRVIRFTYPIELSNGQFMEASLQAYEGKVFIAGDSALGAERDFYEQRSAASFVIYPQPIGFQAEYNIGRGPEYDRDSGSVKVRDLKGGYAMVNYQLYHGEHRFFPFVRFNEYQGGRKIDDNATSYRVTEWELGTEWQPNEAFELTVSYAFSDRDIQSEPNERSDEKGQLLRLQAQFNY